MREFKVKIIRDDREQELFLPLPRKFDEEALVRLLEYLDMLSLIDIDKNLSWAERKIRITINDQFLACTITGKLGLAPLSKTSSGLFYLPQRDLPIEII